MRRCSVFLPFLEHASVELGTDESDPPVWGLKRCLADR
jgi:hypothetical protein